MVYAAQFQGEVAMRRTHQMLADAAKAQAIALLNKQLAAAIDLHGQIRQASWNLRGHGCSVAYDLFDRIAAEVASTCDALAQRARVLGGVAHGTIQIAARQSMLAGYPLGIAGKQPHMRAVANILAGFDAAVQGAIHQAVALGDGLSADLFAEISRGIDQQLWLVESHIAWHMIERPARDMRDSVILAFTAR